MVHFKVIKGSQLLLGIAIAVLIIVIAALAIGFVLSGDSETVHAQADLVQTNEAVIEAETNAVFASISETREALELDPQDSLSIEILPSSTALDKLRVLIYHTHTHEAYEQVSGDQYVAIEAWRTTDQDYSVVRVG